MCTKMVSSAPPCRGEERRPPGKLSDCNVSPGCCSVKVEDLVVERPLDFCKPEEPEPSGDPSHSCVGFRPPCPLQPVKQG